jgi:hypothetical protein
MHGEPIGRRSSQSVFVSLDTGMDHGIWTGRAKILQGKSMYSLLMWQECPVLPVAKRAACFAYSRSFSWFTFDGCKILKLNQTVHFTANLLVSIKIVFFTQNCIPFFKNSLRKGTA